MENTTIAERIRARLDELGKNASAVALEAGLSRSSVLDILKGKAANPRIDTLVKLTGPLQSSLEYLTGAASEPGATPANESFYALMDTQVTSVRMNLETGVFREGYTYASDREEHVLYRDPRAPDRSVALYRIADTSLTEIGILQGDLAHVLDSEIDDLPLSNGTLVVVRRALSGKNLNEFSARVVELDADGDLVLTSKSRDSKPPLPIIVALSDAPNDEPFFSNTYMSTAGDLIEIVGVVCRITRPLKI